MLKSLKVTVLTFTIAAAVTIAPRPSQGYVIAEIAEGFGGGSPSFGVVLGRIFYGIPILGTILCFATLPLCVLEAKEVPANFEEMDLLQNGYTSEEAQKIVEDHRFLNQALVMRKLTFGTAKGETASDIKWQILSIYPQASDLYLNYVIERQGLN